MSVINKKPFINSVLDSLTKDNLTTLASLMNGGAGAVTFKSFINDSYVMSTDDKGIKRLILETKNQVFTGYLLYNNSYCVLAAYEGGSQKMLSIKLDYEEDKYEIVDEDLTIVEFRNIVDNKLVEKGENISVQTDDIDSGSATSGKVLTADGEGGASWETPAAGGVKLYHHTINFNFVDKTGSGEFFGKPIELILATSTPITIDSNFNYVVGRNAIAMSDKDFVLGCSINYSTSNNELVAYDYSGVIRYLTQISDFTDTVIEL